MDPGFGLYHLNHPDPDSFNPDPVNVELYPVNFVQDSFNREN